VLHYCLSNRTDTEFWREMPAKALLCPGLPEKLALWKHKICEYHDLAGGYATTFVDENYRYILYGMQHYPALQYQCTDVDQQVFARLKQLSDKAVDMTLPHLEFLQKLAAAR
jgi:Tryptophan halogenase